MVAFLQQRSTLYHLVRRLMTPGRYSGSIIHCTTGAVMRLKPGHNAEVLIGGCAVCHSVSANGNVIAAASSTIRSEAGAGPTGRS